MLMVDSYFYLTVNYDLHCVVERQSLIQNNTNLDGMFVFNLWHRVKKKNKKFVRDNFLGY